MALAVDAGGKAKANKNTGKVFSAPKVSGSSSGNLKADLERVTGVSASPRSGYAGALANTLSKKTSDTPAEQPVQPLMMQKPTEDKSRSAEPMFVSTESLFPKNDVKSMSPSDFRTPVFRGALKSLQSPDPMIQTSGMSKPQPVLGTEYTRDLVDAGVNFENDMDRYEQDMLANGMSQEYMDKVLKNDHGSEYVLGDINGRKDEADKHANELDPEWRDDLLYSAATMVDDGTMDRQHLLSDYMTGNQYYHYVHDLGMRGMPEDEIVRTDKPMYSKQEQLVEYGFQPYVANSTHEMASFLPALMADTRYLSDRISSARERGIFDDADYKGRFDMWDGEDREFSGRDFDRKSPAYFNELDKLYSKVKSGDAAAISKLIEDPGTDYYTTYVRQTTLPDGSKHYGKIVDDPYRDYDEEAMNKAVLDGEITYDDEGRPLHVKTTDGFTLDYVPSEDDPDMYSISDNENWRDFYNRFYYGPWHVGFSDGSVADLDGSMSGKEVYNLLNESYFNGYENVPFKSTGLDIDPMSLNVSDNPEDIKPEDIVAYYQPDLVLSDGTRIPAEIAGKIASDTDAEDTSDGISYEFEKSGLDPRRYIDSAFNPLSWGYPLAGRRTDNRPRRFLKPLVDEDGQHVLDPSIDLDGFKPSLSHPFKTLDDALGRVHLLDSNLTNNLTDWAANSATISLPYFQWLNALSQAAPYVAGIKGDQRHEGGRYDVTGHDSTTKEGAAANAVAMLPTLFGPALENLAGNIGHETWLDKRVDPLIDKAFELGTYKNIAAHTLYDWFVEGIEENLGDVFGELGTYGRNAYTNPLKTPPSDIVIKDESGKIIKNPTTFDRSGDNENWLIDKEDIPDVMYDEYGNELRDPNTSRLDRLANFIPHTGDQLRDAFNSFAGGAGVSAMLGLPGILGDIVGGHGKRVAIKDREKGTDWSSGAYAEHMANLGKSIPFDGMSLEDARREAMRRRRRQVAAESLASEIDVPRSIATEPHAKKKNDSDIIPYEPGKYAVPEDYELPEIK